MLHRKCSVVNRESTGVLLSRGPGLYRGNVGKVRTQFIFYENVFRCITVYRLSCIGMNRGYIGTVRTGLKYRSLAARQAYSIRPLLATSDTPSFHLLNDITRKANDMVEYHRGDRGKKIHFFEISLSCFYAWIYLIAFRYIINCQVLATNWEKEILA